MLLMILVILTLLILILATLSLQTVLTHWTDTEGMFTMIYLCTFLGLLVGWTLTDVLDINFFWQP